MDARAGGRWKEWWSGSSESAMERGRAEGEPGVLALLRYGFGARGCDDFSFFFSLVYPSVCNVH